jgi:hypothetical protein
LQGSGTENLKAKDLIHKETLREDPCAQKISNRVNQPFRTRPQTLIGFSTAKAIARTEALSGVVSFQRHHRANRGEVILPGEESKAEIIQAKHRLLVEKEFYLRPVQSADGQETQAYSLKGGHAPSPEKCNAVVAELRDFHWEAVAGTIRAGQFREEMPGPTHGSERFPET